MALTVTDATSDLTKPINGMFVQTLLRNAQKRCPYFMGTMPGNLQRHAGTATAVWRRIENLTAVTSALSEVTTAAYMQSRTPVDATFTGYAATVSKYGNFIILNEEVDLFNFTGQMDKLMEIMGINAGESLNKLQRNVAEGNLTAVYAGAAASTGAVVQACGINSVRSVINTLDKNSARTFTPMVNATQNIGTTPLLPAYWGLTHPDVAADIALLPGFKGVETYAGNTNVAMGEFGAITLAGRACRFISSEDATATANAGGSVTGTGLNSTGGSLIDIYYTCIYGQDCLGSLGFGDQYSDGSFMAGDSLGPVEIIYKPIGSGGTSDPYNEIGTLAWKAWHAGKLLNANWGRCIISGSTKLNV